MSRQSGVNGSRLSASPWPWVVMLPGVVGVMLSNPESRYPASHRCAGDWLRPADFQFAASHRRLACIDSRGLRQTVCHLDVSYFVLKTAALTRTGHRFSFTPIRSWSRFRHQNRGFIAGGVALYAVESTALETFGIADVRSSRRHSTGCDAADIVCRKLQLERVSEETGNRFVLEEPLRDTRRSGESPAPRRGRLDVEHRGLQ